MIYASLFAPCVGGPSLKDSGNGGKITGGNSTAGCGGVFVAQNSSDGIYVQGSGEKNNVELDGKSITVCGALTGSIGIVEKEIIINANKVCNCPF